MHVCVFVDLNLLFCHMALKIMTLHYGDDDDDNDVHENVVAVAVAVCFDNNRS